MKFTLLISFFGLIGGAETDQTKSTDEFDEARRNLDHLTKEAVSHVKEILENLQNPETEAAATAQLQTLIKDNEALFPDKNEINIDSFIEIIKEFDITSDDETATVTQPREDPIYPDTLSDNDRVEQFSVFESIDHLTPSNAEYRVCPDQWYLNGDRVDGCSTRLRNDQRPWCSLDQKFEGHFKLCDESEEESSLRLRRIERDQLYLGGIEVLTSSSRSHLYKEALIDLGNAADLGHHDAEATFSLHLILGLHVPQDIDQGVKRLTSLLDLGNPAAQRIVGILQASGLAFPMSPPKSLLNLQFAAMQGDIEAQLVLGYRYNNGVGVVSDCQTALSYYSSVAEKVASRFKRSSHLAYIVERRIQDDSKDENFALDEENLQYQSYLANKGDIAAELYLARLYLTRGYRQDLQKSFDLFQRASDKGNALGKAFLGRMYLEGVGVAADNYTALEFFEQSAKSGNSIGQAGLGQMYMEGRVVDRSPKKAIKYFRLAAEQDSPEGQFHLGQAYLTGDGVPKDNALALKYLNQASKERHFGFGNILAFYTLGNMHQHGKGVVADCKGAISYYKFVAEAGPWSMLFADGWNFWQNGENDRSLAVYSYLSELGYEKAQSNVAMLLDNYYKENKKLLDPLARWPRALSLWKRASDQMYGKARLKVGDYYWYGNGLEVNHHEAGLHYRMAAELTDSKAQAYFNLGYMHHHGMGLPRDLHLAKRFYDMSADASPDANLPATMALIYLGVSYLHHYTNFFTEGIGNIEKVIDVVDIYLITFLTGLLLFVYSYRRQFR